MGQMRFFEPLRRGRSFWRSLARAATASAAARRGSLPGEISRAGGGHDDSAGLPADDQPGSVPAFGRIEPCNRHRIMSEIACSADNRYDRADGRHRHDHSGGSR